MRVTVVTCRSLTLTICTRQAQNDLRPWTDETGLSALRHNWGSFSCSRLFNRGKLKSCLLLRCTCECSVRSSALCSVAKKLNKKTNLSASEDRSGGHRAFSFRECETIFLLFFHSLEKISQTVSASILQWNKRIAFVFWLVILRYL